MGRERGGRFIKEMKIRKQRNRSNAFDINTFLNLYLTVCYDISHLFQSLTFKKSSKSLARSMFMKNLKLIIILSVVVIVSTGISFQEFVIDLIKFLFESTDQNQ